MSTTATIVFAADREVYYVHRGHDGFPDVVVKDINATIKLARGRWSGSEPGQLVSLFYTMHGDPNKRVQSYEPTTGIHGHEDYIYHVRHNRDGWYVGEE